MQCRDHKGNATGIAHNGPNLGQIHFVSSRAFLIFCNEQFKPIIKNGTHDVKMTNAQRSARDLKT